MAEVKKINGYTIKDEQARNDIESLNTNVNQLNADVSDLKSDMLTVKAGANLNTTNIEQLQKENTAIKKDVAQLQNIHNGKYIFIGDSYAEGYSPDGNTTGWCTHVKNNLGISDDDYIKSVYGGVGFCNTVDNKTFLTLLQDVTIDNPENVAYIVVAGGYNDKSYNAGDIDTGVGLFCNYAKTNYPNAKICIGMCAFSTDASGLNSLNDVLRGYSLCGKYGACYMSNIEYALHRIGYMASDGYHPNESGQVLLASYISSFLSGGNIHVVETLFAPVSPCEGVTASNSFKTTINNNITTLSFARHEFLFNTQIQQKAAHDIIYQLCELKDGHIIGGVTNANTYTCVPVKVLLSTNGIENFDSRTAIVKVVNKVLCAYFVDAVSNDYESVDFNTMVIEPFTLTVNSMAQGG